MRSPGLRVDSIAHHCCPVKRNSRRRGQATGGWQSRVMGPQAMESWQPQTRKGKGGLGGSTALLVLGFETSHFRNRERIIHVPLSTPLFGVIRYIGHRKLIPTPAALPPRAHCFFPWCAFAQSLSSAGQTHPTFTDPSNPYHRAHCHLPTLCGAREALWQVCLQSSLYPQRW